MEGDEMEEGKNRGKSFNNFYKIRKRKGIYHLS